jgi:hypothetical protein
MAYYISYAKGVPELLSATVLAHEGNLYTIRASGFKKPFKSLEGSTFFVDDDMAVKAYRLHLVEYVKNVEVRSSRLIRKLAKARLLLRNL